MNITDDQIANILAEFVTRVDAIKASGGISMKDHYEGKKIPDGFIFDHLTQFFYPANLQLDECTRMQ